MGSILSGHFKRCPGKRKVGILSCGPYLNVQTLGVSRLSYCIMPRQQLKDGFLITQQVPHVSSSIVAFLSPTLLPSSSTFKDPHDYVYNTPVKGNISSLMSLCLIPSPKSLSPGTNIFCNKKYYKAINVLEDTTINFQRAD